MLFTRLSGLLSLVLTAGLPAFAEPVLIENVTVVSPEREAPLRDAFVLLDEGRIRSVSAERPPVPKGARVVNGKGRFLVPGLIDSHVHLGMPPGVGIVTADFEKNHGDLLAAYWKQAPRSFLFHGRHAPGDPCELAPHAGGGPPAAARRRGSRPVELGCP